jgi:hypothetical protein
MTHYLGKHSSTGDLQCTQLRINNVDVAEALASKLEAADLSDKQDALTIQNTTSSTFDGTLYARGGLDLSNGTLTYIPPDVIDWTTDQGDTNIDANNIPLLPYAPNQLASNGTPGLTNFNLNSTRKLKLDSIEENAQVNPRSRASFSNQSFNRVFQVRLLHSHHKIQYEQRQFEGHDHVRFATSLFRKRHGRKDVVQWSANSNQSAWTGGDRFCWGKGH